MTKLARFIRAALLFFGRHNDPPFALFILLSVLLLSGCLALRLLDAKHELCSSGGYELTIVDEGTTVTLRKPIILDRDVTCLLDAEPDVVPDSASQANQKIVKYVAEKDRVTHNPNDSIIVALTFEKMEGEYRLKAGQVNKNLATILPATLSKKS